MSRFLIPAAVLASAALASLSGCVGVRESTPCAGTVPGEICELGSGRSITREELLARLATARFVLLGESHDNGHHHRIQAEILQALARRDGHRALAMEQFDTEDQAAIDRVLALPGPTSAALAEATRMYHKGWDWHFYEPLVAIALREDLPIVGANLSRAAARRVVADGLQALGAATVSRLALDATWNAQREATLGEAIREGHCGRVPDGLLPRLVLTQRARDATMADALLTRAPSGAVLILGRLHARNDVGVPLYLHRRAPGATVASVALVEVGAGEERQAGPVTTAPSVPPFDYLWFTPRVERGDPCKEFSVSPAR
ncbi:MAG: ChaN family lipoprotein [Gammaproteobacteria bacterium]|nr:ChaN family lipoprotein [Gammaproteobacteria bacterium]